MITSRIKQRLATQPQAAHAACLDSQPSSIREQLDRALAWSHPWVFSIKAATASMTPIVFVFSRVEASGVSSTKYALQCCDTCIPCPDVSQTVDHICVKTLETQLFRHLWENFEMGASVPAAYAGIYIFAHS
ncbi:TPA: hypothetical protein ACH3X1_006784 [Trebouxia sp. C0004]